MTARRALIAFILLFAFVSWKLYGSSQPESEAGIMSADQPPASGTAETVAAVPVGVKWVSGTPPKAGDTVTVRSTESEAGKVRVLESPDAERNSACDVDAGEGTVILTVVETYAGVGPHEREMPDDDEASFWMGKDEDHEADEKRSKNTVLIRYVRDRPPSPDAVMKGACPGLSGMAVIEEDYFLHQLVRADT